MQYETRVFDPEQLSALQNLFNQAWQQAVSSASAASVVDWASVRNSLAEKVFAFAQSGLPDDEIIRTVLLSLGIL